MCSPCHRLCEEHKISEVDFAVLTKIGPCNIAIVFTFVGNCKDREIPERHQAIPVPIIPVYAGGELSGHHLLNWVCGFKRSTFVSSTE